MTGRILRGLLFHNNRCKAARRVIATATPLQHNWSYIVYNGELAEKSFAHAGGNVTKAVQWLCVYRVTLHKMLGKRES